MTRATADLPEKRWGKEYGRDLGIVFGLYGLAIGVSQFGQRHTEGDARYAISLLPALAFAGLPFVITRMMRRVDERLRDEIRNSIVFSFLWTAVVAVAYGFLEGAGAPEQSMVWVWPVMMVFVVSYLVVNRLRDR
ncbi:MAG TPA: hypothetical protein VFB78_15480 [Acidimicrobiales bacterium]|nr:hypothetical protein [Acidimicrobiales bacterium]